MTTSYQPNDPKPPEQLVAARWRSEVLAWSYTWPTAGPLMPSGKRRSPFRLLQAMIGLADMARADGRLKAGDGSYWTLKQLADAAGMSKSVAVDTLDWLEREGWLAVEKGRPTDRGAGVDERRLVVNQSVQQSSSEVNQPSVHESSSEVNRPGAPSAPAGRFTSGQRSVHKSAVVGSRVEFDGEPLPGIPGSPWKEKNLSKALEEEPKPTDAELDAMADGFGSLDNPTGDLDDPEALDSVEPPSPYEPLSPDGAAVLSPSFAVGDRVQHEEFGDGAVEVLHPNKPLIRVRFDRARFDKGRFDGGVSRWVDPASLKLIVPEPELV
jgi:hypothetical protein